MAVFTPIGARQSLSKGIKTRYIVLYIAFCVALYVGDVKEWIPSEAINRFFGTIQHRISSEIVETTETWNDWRVWLESWQDIRQKNAALRTQISAMEEWRLEALRLRVENRDLLHILDLSRLENESISFLGYGRVITYGLREYPYSAVLALSDPDLEVKNYTVILQGEGLAGRVIESGEGWLRILHVSDGASRVPVETIRSGDRAILIGNNEPRPILGFVSESNQIQNDDLLVTSGHGGVFPAGIPVGLVRVNRDGGFEVELLAPYHSMGWLRILGHMDQDYDF